MNKENEANTSAAEPESNPSEGHRTLGVYLNMHSHIRTTQVEYPKHLVVNKNNVAPCGAETIHDYRRSTLRQRKLQYN